MGNESIDARRKACLDYITAWAEETELKLRRRGVAFTPQERETIDAAKARLAARLQKQDDAFWEEALTPQERLQKIGADLMANVEGRRA